MTRTLVLVSALAALVGLRVPALAGAQTAADMATALNVHLRSGQVIYVTDHAGRTMKGSFWTAAEDGLLLATRGTLVRVELDELSRVHVAHRDSLADGMLTGLGAGALGGMVVALVAEGRRQPRRDCVLFCQGFAGPQLAAAGGAIAGGLAGLAVGAAIDALIKERRLVYEAPVGGGAARLQAGLATSQGGVGIAVLIRW